MFTVVRMTCGGFGAGTLAVLALCLNASAVGAPAAPGARIVSPEPASMRSRLALMLEYSPGFISKSPSKK